MKASNKTNSACVLVVDDEPDIRELFVITLGRMNLEVYSAADLHQAYDLLKKQHFDLCLTDMKLPDGNGIELVAYLQQHQPDLPIAVITAHGNMDSAIRAMKAGAFDFTSKPVELNALRKLVKTALKLRQEDSPASERHTRYTMLGESAVMDKIRATIHKLARSQAPVHIKGESGTGKELVARLIHEKGPRQDHDFVAVNCGAIPPDLMESEFFGHKKGSFTGAVQDKIGLFQAADGGTLFLDEVADLPLGMQVKLLRAIQERSVRPVGGHSELAIDARILCATHKDLEALVAAGDFRQDLYYRLNVIELPVPPLRERAEDIPILAMATLQRLSASQGEATPELQANALESLKNYPFPGNIRELENILERAMTLRENNTIAAKDLNLPQQMPRIQKSVESPPTLTAAIAPLKPGLPEGCGLDEYLKDTERTLIIAALEKVRWNKTAAARELGVSFRTLRYRLKRLDIE